MPAPAPIAEDAESQPEAPALFQAPVGPPADAGEPLSVTPLPRRTPGSSGITSAPGTAQEQQPWWPDAADTSAAASVDAASLEEASVEEASVDDAGDAAEPAASAPTDTSGFFSSRRRAQWEAQEHGQQSEPEPEPDSDVESGGSPSDVDLIYQNMMNEWLVDPQDLQQLATPQDWKSVWDNGWAAAEDAENTPVESHTDHGLPVRQPGARLVPGGTTPGTGEPAQTRDPEAIRSALGSHFGGVRAGRSHARSNTTEGHDHE
jgi:hypothetical protein